MKKIQLLKQIHEQGVVAVLRADNHEQVIEMAEEAILGGIKVIEITMTVPKALRAIEELASKYSTIQDDDKPFAIIGAGTVLDAATARACILAGAAFVVGPSLQEDTVKLCNRYRVPIMPGVMTIADVQTALELGVDIVKLFPGNLYDPSIIKTMKGPLPQANFMPTGGVNVDNLADWIKAGAVAVGIGSDLTKEAVATGDMSCVRKQAQRYMAAYREAVGTSVKKSEAVTS
ncbi:bifunctional 2-keto-4-hydroxyglutarate aldolase/2-keto-3-deoxy-6-phosphogluconate aldolase [Paenibacillus aquistagni]|uniref:bifunctional 2-keto-4-hydroxyglutarate aldolase/2-keto-3-deoxy-6-phosphogluconate aldolase n=1 Tax=Paenibacillus aquistagni TaxID=1852522 RepID=UPI00145A8244|nr:bifunctional 2-keto-4-hydroxyglutarate aldolase/2-keto-3-deoxy-6-phosphogluconate aldolase [Paenibacillus aquistagni]NMM51708.1 bifunctional 2-keto-4-hydroxyglutarate aldolase/2-keto-3-deoxy-6-phosphogluconate aldolase [Paenibacillus aquistagni]